MNFLTKFRRTVVLLLPRGPGAQPLRDCSKSAKFGQMVSVLLCIFSFRILGSTALLFREKIYSPPHTEGIFYFSDSSLVLKLHFAHRIISRRLTKVSLWLIAWFASSIQYWWSRLPASPINLSTIVYRSWCFSVGSQSQSDNVIRTADMYYEKNEMKELHHFLKEFENSVQPELVWRLARATYELSKIAEKDDEKKRLIYEAFRLSEKALTLDDNNFACHKVRVRLSELFFLWLNDWLNDWLIDSVLWKSFISFLSVCLTSGSPSCWTRLESMKVSSIVWSDRRKSRNILR